jgi:hypothetical protein
MRIITRISIFKDERGYRICRIASGFMPILYVPLILLIRMALTVY